MSQTTKQTYTWSFSMIPTLSLQVYIIPESLGQTSKTKFTVLQSNGQRKLGITHHKRQSFIIFTMVPFTILWQKSGASVIHWLQLPPFRSTEAPQLNAQWIILHKQSHKGFNVAFKYINNFLYITTLFSVLLAAIQSWKRDGKNKSACGGWMETVAISFLLYSWRTAQRILLKIGIVYLVYSLISDNHLNSNEECLTGFVDQLMQPQLETSS